MQTGPSRRRVRCLTSRPLLVAALTSESGATFGFGRSKWITCTLRPISTAITRHNCEFRQVSPSGFEPSFEAACAAALVSRYSSRLATCRPEPESPHHCENPRWHRAPPLTGRPIGFVGGWREGCWDCFSQTLPYTIGARSLYSLEGLGKGSICWCFTNNSGEARRSATIFYER